MVGQYRLVSFIDKHVESSTLPRTLLFEGEWGCGKHTLAAYTSEKLGIELLDITEMLNLDTLDQIALSATPRVYMINCSEISVKDQNTILKFLEEPLKNSYIILLSENKSSLLNTVMNRCICLSFEQYTVDELAQFGEPSDFANTPGRVIEFQQYPILDMQEFAKKVLLQIHSANHSNILTIPNRISFKTEEPGFPFDVFTYLLVNVASKLYCSGHIPYNVYLLTDTFYTDCKIPHINKRHLLEHYLIELKQVLDGGL